MAQSVRNSEYYKKLKTSRFEQIILRPELSGQPIILEQVIGNSSVFWLFYILYFISYCFTFSCLLFYCFNIYFCIRFIALRST